MRSAIGAGPVQFGTGNGQGTFGRPAFRLRHRRQLGWPGLQALLRVIALEFTPRRRLASWLAAELKGLRRLRWEGHHRAVGRAL